MQARRVREVTSPQPTALAIVQPLAEQGQVEFTLEAPQALAVFLAGEFNHWDPKRTPLKKDHRGVWKAAISLPPGRHQYRFVVDGQWISDPNAKESIRNPYGSTNSVLII